MNNEKKRLLWIDTSKGIAILFVVIGHMIPMTSKFSIWFYSFHIPIFFMISGVLIQYSSMTLHNISAKDIIAKKAKALLYPYFVFSLFSVVKIFITDGIKSAGKGVVNTLLFDGIDALWFLPSLFIAELLFLFLKKYTYKKFFIFCLYAVAFVITSIFSYYYYAIYGSTGYILKILLKILNEINRALIGSIFVCIGYYSYAILKKMSSKMLYLCCVFLISMFISFGIFFVFYNIADLHYSIIGNPIVYYVAAIAGSYFVFSFSMLISYIEKYIKYNILTYWGKNSLIIFLTHLNLGITLISKKLSFFNSCQTIQSIVIIMVIETVLVLIINKWFPFLIDYKSACKLFGSCINKVRGNK